MTRNDSSCRIVVKRDRPVDPGFVFLTSACEASDVVQETTASFARISDLLGQQGLSFYDVVRIRMTYTDASDYAAMDSVRGPLYRSAFTDGAFPSSAGPVIDPHGENAARVEMEVVAHSGKRTAISPRVASSFGGPQPTWVHVTEAGGIAFMSGQTAWEADGTYMRREPPDQAQKVLGAIEPIMAEVGRSLSDLQSLTLYLSPVAAGVHFTEVSKVIEAYLAGLGGALPAVTVVGAKALVFDPMCIGVEAVAGPAGATQTAAIINGGGDLVRFGSNAVRAEDFVTASVTSALNEAEAALGEAASTLAQVLDEVGGPLAPGSLVTCWYAAPVTRELVERDLGGLLRHALPAALVHPVLMRQAQGGEAVTLEVYGTVPRAEGANDQEMEEGR